MNKIHSIEGIVITSNSFSLIIDGEQKVFPLNSVSNKLISAGEIERNTFEVSPSGYGIHWPLLDEDISFDALLGIVHHPIEKRKIA